jgi:phage gp45-like
MSDRAANRLKGMVTLGRVRGASGGAAARGEVLVEGMAGADEVPVVQAYGFQSRPADGAEAVVVQVGSNADQALAIAVDDRRYRIALAGGEVAIYDDLGSRVVLKRGGVIEVEATTVKLGASATAGVARVGDTVAIGADLAAWILAVTAATGVTPLVGSTAGAVSTGSAKVKAE